MKVDKDIEKMRRNKRNWTINKLKTIASRYGIDCRNNSTTHHVFKLSGVVDHVCIPFKKKDIHPDYITQFLRLIDQAVILLEELEEENKEE